ncbi:sulfite oxidase-like oxidoreductase [bacterium]|nr:sulfite oxidase-like oxidoreductase [bacterium]
MKKIVSSDTLRAERIAPGQYQTEKFPVLTYGPTPRIDTKEWKLEIFGEVEQKIIMNWDQFMDLPKVEVFADFHCVTTWSRLDNRWEGVLFSEIVKLAGVKPSAKFVMQHCYGGYTTNLPLEVMMDGDVVLAYRHDGESLPIEHGGPMRVIVPKRYAWKSAKWVRGIELMANDREGFWERNGYSNSADQWKEERYWEEK